MRSTVPALLFFMATPVTQAAELRTLHVLDAMPEPTPSVVGALSGHALAPTEIGSRYSGQITWVMDTSDLRPVSNEITSYRALTPKWDGAEGCPGLPWSIDAALDYVASLPPDVADPVPMISPSGEVGLYWMDRGAYAEIGFDEAGTCFMFAEAPGRSSIHLDDLEPGDPALMAALRGILGLVERAPLAA